ncbi:MAG: 16S rRNA (adenine(1518)-N(6)/adenine(1519)-N(6))-dimethyltransferase, partial [Burkholderiaceae bacterium]
WLAARGFEGAFDLQRRAEAVPAEEYWALAQAVSAAS